MSGSFLIRRAAPLLFSMAALAVPASAQMPKPAPDPVFGDPSLPRLTALADTPEWRVLDVYQQTVTREQFDDLIKRIYSPDGSFFTYFSGDNHSGTVWRDKEKTVPLWTLRFAPNEAERIIRPYPFSAGAEARLRGATPELPLKGLTICLDPGHIGGSWANLEERYMKIGSNPPVIEGELNLTACRLLEPLLQQAGARVVWTKQDTEPVTPTRPSDFTDVALVNVFQKDPKAATKSTAKVARDVALRSDLLFYRVAEIQARAQKIAELKPDFTLCVHFNAAPDPSIRRPRLWKANKLVVFVHGSYTSDEMAYDDQKYDLLRKLLEDTAQTEIDVGDAVAEQMASQWGFPPEDYSGWNASNRVGPNPYVWSRNLLANRLFPGPTIFIEGPYMNDRSIYPRLIAGDYEGEKKIDGKLQKSIFREFAKIIADGVIARYKALVPLEPPAPPAPAAKP